MENTPNSNHFTSDSEREVAVKQFLEHHERDEEDAKAKGRNGEIRGWIKENPGKAIFFFWWLISGIGVIVTIIVFVVSKLQPQNEGSWIGPLVSTVLTVFCAVIAPITTYILFRMVAFIWSILRQK